MRYYYSTRSIAGRNCAQIGGKPKQGLEVDFYRAHIIVFVRGPGQFCEDDAPFLNITPAGPQSASSDLPCRHYLGAGGLEGIPYLVNYLQRQLQKGCTSSECSMSPGRTSSEQIGTSCFVVRLLGHKFASSDLLTRHARSGRWRPRGDPDPVKYPRQSVQLSRVHIKVVWFMSQEALQ